MSSSGDFAVEASELERSGSLPLWAQLEHELRRRMELGHFADRFPTDRELMEIYGVSRHTARHAVSRLGADGILRRSRGIGTSVDRRTFERSLGALYSLFQVVEESGVPQHSSVRALERVQDTEAAEQLGLEPGTELVYIDRVRFAGDEPLAIDRIWLPSSIADQLLDADFTHTSLYNELDRTIGKRPNEGWERIHPAIPSDDERDCLELAEGEAVFSIERLGTFNGEPLEWRVTTIRGDRFTFVADWTAGQRNELGSRWWTAEVVVPAVHPQLAHVAGLLGTWTGRGRGEYPTIAPFDYAESITFGHVGKPFLSYTQRTRSLGVDGSPPQPMHAESGYWRFPAPGIVEVVLSHPTGVVEIEEGTIEVELDGSLLIELMTTTVARSTTAKEVTALQRRFRVRGDTIDYAVAMAAVGVPLRHHLRATLHREFPD